MEKIRVFEAFAGYGSQAMALKRLQSDYPQLNFEFVGISEIDKYAIKAYNAVHGDVNNYGDISKIDWSNVPDFDLFTYSFPCQDISNAGKMRGFSEGSGTRSSLLWECKRAIENKLPRFLLMENVKALVGKKNMDDFTRWVTYLHDLGYRNYWNVINAKDYGIPQNRERVFMVSIYGGCDPYVFPEKMELKIRLKDVLESEVDEMYYLSDKAISWFLDRSEKSTTNRRFGSCFNPTDGSGISKCIKASRGDRSDDNFILEIPEATKKGYTECEPGGVFDASYPESKTRRGRCIEKGQIAPTITSQGQGLRVFEKSVSTGIKRLDKLVDSGKIDPEKVMFLDVYNQIARDDIAGAITTRINNSNKFISESKVLTRRRTEYGKSIRKEYENGEIQAKRNEICEYVPREDGISNTITTVEKDNYLFEPFIKQYPRGFNHVFEFRNGICPSITTSSWENNNFLVEQISEGIEYKGKIINDGDGLYLSTTDSFFRGGLPGISRTIKANVHDAGVCVGYRIRKLTPRECFRLMDVSESDIDKIQDAGISNSQQYKMAGNSIVVSCLYYIFKNLFCEKEVQLKGQLSLF